jgi:hypothetical protein
MFRIDFDTIVTRSLICTHLAYVYRKFASLLSSEMTLSVTRSLRMGYSSSSVDMALEGVLLWNYRYLNLSMV